MRSSARTTRSAASSARLLAGHDALQRAHDAICHELSALARRPRCAPARERRHLPRAQRACLPATMRSSARTTRSATSSALLLAGHNARFINASGRMGPLLAAVSFADRPQHAPAVKVNPPDNMVAPNCSSRSLSLPISTWSVLLTLQVGLGLF